METKKYNTTKATKEELALEHALGHVLSSWPENWNPESVINEIGKSDAVSVWEPLEHLDSNTIIREARSIASTLLQFAHQTLKDTLIKAEVMKEHKKDVWVKIDRSVWESVFSE